MKDSKRKICKISKTMQQCHVFLIVKHVWYVRFNCTHHHVWQSYMFYAKTYYFLFWTKLSWTKNPKNWKTILSYLLFFNVMNIRLFVRVPFSPFVGTFFFVKGLFHLCHHKDLLLPRNFNLNIWIYIHKHTDSEEKSKIFRKTNSV